MPVQRHRNPISQDFLREKFSYDAETGILFRKRQESASPRWNARHGNKAAGCRNYDGYHIIEIEGHRHQLHNVIWQLAVGAIPDGKYIDHINGDRADNRLANLRSITMRENNQNRSISSTGRSGILGVRRCKYGRWLAQATINYKNIHIGTFDTIEAAARAAHDFRVANYAGYTGRIESASAS